MKLPRHHFPLIDELASSGIISELKEVKLYALQPDTPNRVAYLGFTTPDDHDLFSFTRIVSARLEMIERAWEEMREEDRFRVRVVPVEFGGFYLPQERVCWDLANMEIAIRRNGEYRKLQGGRKVKTRGWFGYPEPVFGNLVMLNSWIKKFGKPTWSSLVPNNQVSRQNISDWKPVAAYPSPDELT